MSSTLRTALAVTATLAGVIGLASTALADDAHPSCVNAVACTGNIVDLHDIPVTIHDIVLHLIGQ